MYLFIGLYALYGIVHGLCNSVRVLVADADTTPRVLQTTMTLFDWSALFAVFVAPVVEAVFLPFVGRRKTWIAGAQFAVGAVMLLMLPLSGTDTGDADQPLGDISALLLALSLSLLHILAAVHEVATDAWGKKYIHHKYEYATFQ